MKRGVGILLLGLCIAGSAFGTERKTTAVPQAESMSPEREQQFTYYWYASHRSIERDDFPKALLQMQFCEQLNPQDALIKERLGLLYGGIGQDSLALSYFQQAYQLDPSERWYQYVVALSKLNTEPATREVLRISRQVAKVHPDEAGCWGNVYNAAVKLGEYKEALKAVDKAVEIEGNNALNAYHRFYIYVCMGKKKKALQALDDYLAIEPYDLRILLTKVDFLARTQAPAKQQIAALLAVLRVDPNNLVTLNNYAFLLATTGGDLRKAEQMSLQTIREEPENAIFLDTYAWILHLQGQDALAGFYIRKALQNASEADKPEIEQHYKAIVK